MKAFVTADWHLGVTQHGIIQDDGRNSRLADAEDVICRMIDWASVNEVDLFVMAGDIFHTNKPGLHEQLAFWRILRRFEQSHIKWVRFITGNHDYNSKLGASHALSLFQEILSEHGQIKIFSETDWEVFYPLTDHQFMVCYYPYKGTPPDWARLAESGPVASTALVCHSHLQGAVVGAEPFEIRDDAATNIGSLPVDHVWAGHFHKPQHLCDSPIAFYPGSPYPIDFNERVDVKGGVLVDVFGRTYDTVGFKTRRLYQFDLPDVSQLHKFMASTGWEDTYVTDAIVKFNVELDEKDAHAFDEAAIREKLIAGGAHSIASINLKVNRQAVIRDPEIKLDSDLGQNYTKFVQGRDYGDYAEAVRVKGMEIIKQCAS